MIVKTLIGHIFMHEVSDIEEIEHRSVSRAYWFLVSLSLLRFIIVSVVFFAVSTESWIEGFLESFFFLFHRGISNFVAVFEVESFHDCLNFLNIGICTLNLIS